MGGEERREEEAGRGTHGKRREGNVGEREETPPYCKFLDPPLYYKCRGVFRGHDDLLTHNWHAITFLVQWFSSVVVLR